MELATNLVNKTKMEHLSDEQQFAIYRLQARRALLSYSFVSFSVGMMVAFAICVWSHSLRSQSEFGDQAGTLKCNQKQLCLNTSLA